uniref:Isopentenyl phosphate kinase n=1 Tax=Noctiluca scintillans TaxID=2966 RepID=A0A7S1AIS9_NOCSC|mmetsp:Transcript_48034/g.127199  ORF Transcript_48034/g.127199 Transcript_48034/m.127199 type:complete len:285 (+) Transcript_48034:50-904(+)
MECVDVVVKIGGSACTKKAEFETLNEVALGESAAQLAALAAEGTSLAIVHGAGSFGHQYARQYNISSGGESGGARPLPAITREGFAKTRLSVSKLNRFVTEALVEHGLPAVSLCPCPFVCTTGKKLSGGRLPESAVNGARALLSSGLVPLVHGDAVLDDAQGVAILSGDIWMVELARELGAKSAVFITDVDGVFTKPPTEPDAELVREILFDLETKDLELTGVSMNVAGHDVTGGLKAKLDCAGEVLLGAPSVEAVYIVRAGSESAAEALRGEVPSQGTTLRRK